MSMAQRYRLTPIRPSNAPRNQRESEQFGEETNYQNQRPYYSDESRMYASRSASRPRSSTVVWGLIALVALAVIVGGAIWMSGISASVAHLNHTAQQNSRALATQHAQLTGIQAQLHQMSLQLAQISQQISTFFGNILQAISNGKL